MSRRETRRDPPGFRGRSPCRGHDRRVSRRRFDPGLRRRRPEARGTPAGARGAAGRRARTPGLEQGRGPRLRPTTRGRARMIMKRIARVTAAILLAGLAGGAPAAAQQPVELSFYYPVAVGGPVTK